MIIKNSNTFHLQGKSISYIITVGEHGDLLHYYYGAKISDRDYSKKIKCKNFAWVCTDEDGLSLDTLPQEYPAYGYTDLRYPAYSIKNKFGNMVSRLIYKNFCIKENETPTIEGMPSIFKGNKNAQTLEITLCDDAVGIEVILYYTVFDEYDVILRSSKIINKSDKELCIESAYSASMDFDKKCYEVVYFPGAWTREREFVRTKIKMGEKIDISNARGGSGHSMNPFVMICSSDTTEKYGDVYGFSLIYSGNHSTHIECDQYSNLRVMQGVNPFEFEAVLNSDESFYTPQSVICYSDKGFGGISRQMHDVYRDNLCINKWSNMDRPVLINNWEATYFDFDEEKLLKIAEKAKNVGIELFVLDDGWFRERNDDTCSLGDWCVNKKKLPSGIDGLADKINKLDLKFGLWFEPEVVNPDSDLYRRHPEWAISVPNTQQTLGRNEYMLDLTNEDVCQYIIDTVGNILKTTNISYVKWDYNRVMSTMPYKGYNHKYTLGLYKVMDTLVKSFPDVLFEGCSGGGGRFDAGILAYSPQIWTSDNSDAVSRLKIQYSTSFCYPVSTMSAHVSASPNHQVGRETSLKTRADVAYAGIFGYELDITQMSDYELDEVSKQVEFYKEIRKLVRTGDFYRLQSPYESNYCSWQIVSKDKSEVFVFGSRILSYANSVDERILLEGLEQSGEYIDTETGEVLGGDELMHIGIDPIYENKDFSTFIKMYKIR